MYRIKRSLLTISTICMLLFWWQGPTAAQNQEARILELGKPVERELAGEQAHNYLIELATNDFLHVIVEQRGVDVVVTVYAPDGKKLKEVDSPNGDAGPEPVLLIAETAGAYRLEIRSLVKGATGKYAATLIQKRTATTEDREHVTRQEMVEQAQGLSNQAISLQQQGLYKDAAPLFQRALAIFEKVLGPSGDNAPPRAPQGESPLLRSGLILAGVNQRKSGPGEDGVLTALEAAGLDLFGTKLVVLSACETGLGDIQNGQGVYGLRRALVLAGSETQIMSLWKVSDDATRALMVAYYKRLQVGEGRVAAMRAVQLEMLRGELKARAGGGKHGTTDTGEKVATKDYRHPYYWAAFIQSGDWRNMQGK